MAAPWVPQHHRDITLQRLAGFCSDGWARDNINSVLYQRRGGDVALEVYSAPDGTRPSFADVVNQTFRPCKVGDSFGPSWSTHWFRVHIQVPSSWPAVSDAPLLFVWDSGSEAMVWTGDGQPQQGLTDQRSEYQLAPSVQPGASYLLYVEMACNGVGGIGGGDIQPPATDKHYTLKTVELAVPDLLAQQLLTDFLVVADMAKTLPADSAVGSKALFVANAMVNTFRRADRTTWVAARKLAEPVLARGTPSVHKVTAVGHCHIDTAWLWPFEETHRKVARSWSAQLQLLDKYPQHVFTASSAQQYAWLKADYPGLWSRVCDAVKTGRFIPVGGSWVEMDTNLPSGESLVRQLLYGQRFFSEAFGKRSEVFWLPDTFGYAAQLPQIVRGAGMKYFLTQKLSWNNINSFPHNTFLWQALDGTSVLTHFPPANTYNSQATVSDLLMSCTNHKDKDRAPTSLLLFGNGDGGGGPTQAMCEAMSRLSDPDGQGIQGLVPCVQGGPEEFFRETESQAHDLLTWRGELYFELHRGTYTSHAANKLHNRQCEGLLKQVELVAALATALGAGTTSASSSPYQYPHKELYEVWTEVLLYQFHDVLPGSSIGMVYDHTAAAYPALIAKLDALRHSALSALTLSLTPQAPASPSPPPSHTPHLSHTDSVLSNPLGPTVRPGMAPTAVGGGSVGGCAVSVGNGYRSSGGALSGEAGEGGQTVLSAEDVMGAYVLVDPADCGAHIPHAPAPAASPASAQHTANTLYDYSNSSGDDAHVSVQDTSAQQRQGAACGSLRATERQERGSLAGGVQRGGAQRRGSNTGVWVFNSLPHGRDEVVIVSADMVPDGVEVQQVGAEEGPTPGAALFRVSLPPVSLTPLQPPIAQLQPTSGVRQPPCEHPVTAQVVSHANGEMQYQLMNRCVRVVLDSRGRLVSLYDRVCHRELVPEGGLGNRFRMYEDIPIFWDAWDVEVYHLEKGWDTGTPVRLEVVESGPLRASLHFSCELSSESRLRQWVCLEVDSPRVEFVTQVDWHESHKVLKVEFPWALHSDTATYEVQFGAVTRPTHTNTSWDWARFEVVGHRWACALRVEVSQAAKRGWADLSEPDYGIAMLNDCKYGHATHGNVQRLTLLKSPKAPDANTDMGMHVFRYAVLPHAGGWQSSGVVCAAAAFNTPPLVLPGPSTASTASLASPTYLRHVTQPLIQVERFTPSAVPTATPPLILDTVKVAEEPWPVAARPGAPDAGTTLLVVRLYEPCGSRGRACVRLTPALNITRAASGNLLEDILQDLPVLATDQHLPDVATPWRGKEKAKAVVVEYRPFQILTLLLWVSRTTLQRH